MRISVRKDDPAFRWDAFEYDVFVDGEELRACFTADEELGQAWYFKHDVGGGLICDGRGKPIEAEKYGKIEIRRREP